MLRQSGNAEKAKGYTNHLPSGYVTYDEMKARLERKKNEANTSEQRENGKRKTKLPLTNYKAETRQRLCESVTNGDDTVTKAYKLRLPQRFVTPKEMEERMAEKRNSAKYRKERQCHRCDNNEEEVIYRRNFCSFNDTITEINGSEKAKGYTKRLPSGYVTYDEMKARLERTKNKVNTSEQRETGKRKTKLPLTNYKAETRQRLCESETNGDDTITEGYKLRLPQRFVTPKEMEERMAGRRQSAKYHKDRQCHRWDNNEEKSPPFKIIIMNVGGPYDERGTVPERRRHAIQTLILKYTPAVLLLQEFKWKDIRGKIWKACPIPGQYYYQGHGEASLIHDECLISMKDLGTIMRQVLEGLQRSSSNQLKVTFPLHFDPLPRMCSKLLHSRLEPSLSIICISWHGVYNSYTKTEKTEYFKYLIEFFRNIHIKMNLPILIGGDFNIAIKIIERYVSKPFKLHKYIASKRRSKAGIIDFFITTDDLNLTSTTFVDLETLDPESHPNDIFDHDPVYAVLSNE